jgi:RHS repeat-associated protein
MEGAGGVGGLLARTDLSGNLYYHADGNGNVTMLVDAGGNRLAEYLYDPYGNTLGMWGSLAAGNTYRFSSKEIDANSGAYYFGYRYYQPNLQRWLTRDPIGEFGGINLYRFVRNRPIDAIDPDRQALWINWPIINITYNLVFGPSYTPTDGEPLELPEEYEFPSGTSEASTEMPLEAPTTWVPPSQIFTQLPSAAEAEVDFATPPPIPNVLEPADAQAVLNSELAKPAQLGMKIECNDGGTVPELFEDGDLP